MAGGGPGQALLALNKNTGATVWKTQDDKMTHSTPVVGSVLGTKQVIFFTQEGLVSVAPANGAVLWRYSFPFNISTAISPVICGNDIVYCSAGYGVGAGAVKITKSGNTFTAKEIYRVTGDKALANHWSTPVYKDGFLYGMFQFKEYGTGPVKCVEAATGKIMWEQPGFGPGNVTVADGKIVALSDAGELVVIAANPKAYTELSRAKILAGKCWSTPVFSGGRVYARSTKEGVCLDVSAKSAGAQ
jgi:outer membrane protein assembly factor BamB